MRRRPPAEPVALRGVDLTNAGVGRARWQERSIFVPDLLPGEEALVRIVHLSKGAPEGWGEVVELREAAPGRREAPCADHGSRRARGCDGCPLMTLAIEAQRELKRNTLARVHGIEVDRLVGADAEQYRWSAKRVVGGRAGALTVGSYRRGTHEVAPMHGCRVDHPRLLACAEEVRRVGNDLGIAPYREPTRRGGRAHGDLRYLWMKTDGERVLLTLVSAAAPSRAARELAPALREPDGIAWSVQDAAGNAMRGQSLRHLRGLSRLRFGVGAEAIDVGPLGFLQPNPKVAALASLDLIRDPSGRPLEGELAFDLYAGSGATSKRLRRTFANVWACESYPESAAMLDVPPQDAASFIEEAVAEGARPDLVVANPPRSGLGPRVCELLLQLRSERVQIMSCNPESLRRDLDVLAARYRLELARAYDTLPHTAHIEVLVWLARREASSR